MENTYPLPLMKDMLNHLSKGKMFTKLDLREAYYHIKIKEEDKWKTAFNCPPSSFQFKVMPFSLQVAAAVFMQLINELLHEPLYKEILIYLGDTLICSETLEEHAIYPNICRSHPASNKAVEDEVSSDNAKAEPATRMDNGLSKRL
ncbi:PREDICTED: RNA-directed DNA polymerase homolog [Thamnophis sirtalis]|uniref:ribonuclease H n=1 Tax=Thamnophis sirtalis TaxID=35019 RepID=A0A6I9YXQ7_9SAUR|nr:PREDICTED: RNA-directed DNA polymerase homolog [Thamnophis sirtalis]